MKTSGTVAGSLTRQSPVARLFSRNSPSAVKNLMPIRSAVGGGAAPLAHLRTSVRLRGPYTRVLTIARTEIVDPRNLPDTVSRPLHRRSEGANRSTSRDIRLSPEVLIFRRLFRPEAARVLQDFRKLLAADPDLQWIRPAPVLANRSTASLGLIPKR